MMMAAVLLFTLAGAQTATMKGFVVGGGLSENGNNTYSVIGQTFAGQTSENGFVVSTGMAQTQLVREYINATVNYGEGYNANGFSYPPETPVGTHEDKLYLLQGATYHYDLVKYLKLVVLKAVSCGELVYDGDHHEYQTVAVAGYCWTKKNLYAEHYPDETTEIADAMAYQSSLHSNANANVNTYGRLYTWTSAVKADADGQVTPVDGYVQGICPSGWHIPTKVEMDALKSLSAEDIRTTELWTQPNSNTNSTQFTALPAGMYKASLSRFEGLGSQTDWWYIASTPGSETQIFASLQAVYYCDTAIEGNPNADDGLSVRCVKNE